MTEVVRDGINEVIADLGMTLEIRGKGKVSVDMSAYVESMLNDFPVVIDKTARTPAGENLMSQGNGKFLDEKRREERCSTPQ